MIRTALLVLTAALPTAAAAQDATPFTFQANWFAQGEHGGYYQALADGTYEACGLDVTIVPGGPGSNGRAKLAAGRVDAYMGGLLRAFDAVREGVPSVIVAAHFQKEPQILMSHPGQGFDTFGDLTDAETLIISDSGLFSFFKWLESEHGFDASKRRPYTYSSAPFLADPQSVQQGYLSSEPFAIAREAGFEPNVFLLADHGFDTYSTTVEVMRDTLETRADDVRCFVEGSALGWANYLYGDASAADALILDANPDMTQEQLDYTRAKLVEFGIVDSGDALTKGIGAIDPERVRAFYRDMVEAGATEAGIDVDAAFTLDFVNQGYGLDALERLRAGATD